MRILYFKTAPKSVLKLSLICIITTFYSALKAQTTYYSRATGNLELTSS